ncbi:unnamed protein product [Caenorhabditis nigoni]
MKPSVILFLLAILIFSRCASSREPDDDFFSFLEFPDVRNISEGFQTNATGFEILEEDTELAEESVDLTHDSSLHRHPKNLENLEEAIEMPEGSMDLPDDTAYHRHSKNLKNSKPTEQMNIVISIVITVLLILLLVIVVVLGPCVLLIVVLILAGLAYYAIRKILKYLEDRRFRASNRASVGFEMREF